MALFVPESLYYSKDHLWVEPLANGTARIGLTEYAQSQLGDLVYVELPTIGDHYERGEVCGTIESVKTTADLIMPIAGEVVSVNDEVVAKPELINSDPYGDGWLFVVKMDDPADLEELLDAESYQRLVEAQVSGEEEEED